MRDWRRDRPEHETLDLRKRQGINLEELGIVGQGLALCHKGETWFYLVP